MDSIAHLESVTQLIAGHFTLPHTRPMSRAPENPLAMRSTQPVIDCRLEPMCPTESPDEEARRIRLRDQRALLAGARAVEHELSKVGASGTPIVTLSSCLKIAKAVINAYRNAEWAEESNHEE